MPDTVRLEYLTVVITFITADLVRLRWESLGVTVVLLICMTVESHLVTNSSRFRTGTPRGLWCVCLPLLFDSPYQWEAALITVTFAMAFSCGIAVENSMAISFAAGLLSLITWWQGGLVPHLIFLTSFVLSNVVVIRSFVESFALGECLLITSGIAHVTTWLSKQSYQVAQLVFRIFDSPVRFAQDFLSVGHRLNLVIFWLFCSTIALAFPPLMSYYQWNMAITVKRKFFHLIITVIFISGVMYDPELALVASLLVLAAFIFLEVLRLYQLQPIAKLCDLTYEKFLDEKDTGPLVLSHIYLLAGCFLPLWLSPINHDRPQLHHFAGVIAIGIGDSAAAIFGKRYGQHKWPWGSKKSFEGSTACFFAQYFAALLISRVCTEKIIDMKSLVIQACAYAIVTVLEAVTSLADNIVLPLMLQIWLKLL